MCVSACGVVVSSFFALQPRVIADLPRTVMSYSIPGVTSALVSEIVENVETADPLEEDLRH
jgi:predicted polyphosphate/ATP-dependent NAD kinase